MTREGKYDELLGAVAGIASQTEDGRAALQAVCELLRDSVAHYDWVGFYLADHDARALVLGPFAGAPTEHVRIPYGRGVCGQAAESGRTLVVQDVRKEPNYLSCSPLVRSEIVLPVSRAGRLVAQLDIDSRAVSAFTDEDVAFLEQVAAAVAKLF